MPAEPAKGSTPGPWTASGNSILDPNGFGIGEADGYEAVLDDWSKKFPKAKHWASQPGASRPISEDEAEANALLMAAAPDLLAACKALLKLDIREDANDSANEAILNARAAIALALASPSLPAGGK